MNTRHTRGTIRAKDTAQGIVTVRAFTYDTLDSYMTVFRPGSATKSLNARLPTIHGSHSWDIQNLIGRAISWRDTSAGPEVTFRLDLHPDVPVARQVLAQIESGTLTDVSIGFASTRTGRREPTKDEMKRWPGVDWVYDEIEVQEISVVPQGAVPGAEILALRSPMQRVQSALDRLRSQRSGTDDELDQMMDEAIETAIRALRRSSPIAADDVRRRHELAKRTRR